MSVASRFPEIVAKHKSSYSDVHFDAVEEALRVATPDMFATYIGGTEPRIVSEFVLFDSGAFMSWGPDSDVSTGVLTPWGLSTTFGYAPSDTAHILYTRVQLKPLPTGTPVLVWEADEHSVVFVTLDGETYSLSWDSNKPALSPDVASPDDWPEPIANAGFGRMAFVDGRRTQTTPLGPPSDAFSACADKAWDRAVQSLPAAARDEPPMSRGSVIRKACRKEIVAWEKAFEKNIAASVDVRKALYELAKSRLHPGSAK